MKNYLHFFISCFLILSLDAMKRGDNVICDDLEEGLNPWDDPSTNCKSDDPSTNCKTNSFSRLVQYIGNDTIPITYTGFKQEYSNEEWNDQPNGTQNALEDHSENKKKNDDKKNILPINSDVNLSCAISDNTKIVYSKNYFRRLFFDKKAITDDYHCIPQSFVWCIMESLKAECGRRVYHKKNEYGNFTFFPFCKRVLPVLFFSSSLNKKGCRYSDTRRVMVITDVLDKRVHHIGFEKIDFEEEILVSADEYFFENISDDLKNRLNIIVQRCHKNNAAKDESSKKQRYQRGQVKKKILHRYLEYPNQNDFFIEVKDANILGYFPDVVFVCDNLSQSNNSKLLYYPLNKEYPAGIFIRFSVIPENVLAHINTIQY